MLFGEVVPLFRPIRYALELQTLERFVVRLFLVFGRLFREGQRVTNRVCQSKGVTTKGDSKSIRTERAFQVSWQGKPLMRACFSFM